MSLTKRQIEIVEQFEDSVYGNMADQVYYNMRNATRYLIDNNNEEDLIELARAFKVDDVTIKCGNLEDIQEEIIISAEQYIFEIIDWKMDPVAGSYRPIGFEPPRGKKSKVFRIMHLQDCNDTEYMSLESSNGSTD